MAQASEPVGEPASETGGPISYTGVAGGDVVEPASPEQHRQRGEMWDGGMSPGTHFIPYPQGMVQPNAATGDTGMLYPQLPMGGSVQIPFGTSEWRRSEEQAQSGWGQLMSLSPCCPGYQTQSTTESMFPSSGDEQYLWRWTREGKLQLTCGQPIVPVPVIQEVHRRDKIIEVPQVDVLDAVKPKVFNQGVEHEVPVMHIHAEREDFDIKQFKYVETEVVVPIVTGFTHKFVPKWEIREVPRPVVKYVGKQEVIEVEVPQVKFVDRVVEREVVVDTIEKKVPKIIEVPKYVDTVKYVWTPVEKIVHVERFVPVFDVSLECPAPLIVPYPVQAVKEMPAVMVRKAIPGATEDGVVVEERHVLEVSSPSGTVRVPEEYIREYRRPLPGERLVCCELPGLQQEPGAQADRSPGGVCAGVCGEDAQQEYLTADEMRRLRGMPPSGDEGKQGDEGGADDYSVDEVESDEEGTRLAATAAEAVLARVDLGERLMAAAAESEEAREASD